MPYSSVQQARYIHSQASKGKPWAKRFVAHSHGTHVRKRKRRKVKRR